MNETSSRPVRWAMTWDCPECGAPSKVKDALADRLSGLVRVQIKSVCTRFHEKTETLQIFGPRGLETRSYMAPTPYEWSFEYVFKDPDLADAFLDAIYGVSV